MGLVKRVFMAFGAHEDSKIPIASVIEEKTEYFDIPVGASKYEWYSHFWKKDPEIYTGINKLAKMVKTTYQGVILKAGKKLEEEEIKTLVFAKEIANLLEFEDLFFASAKNLLKDGDVIHYLEKDGTGSTVRFKSVPIMYMTVLESASQIGNVGAQVFNRGVYVFAEGDMLLQKIWQPSEVCHISLDSFGEEVKDRFDRYTYGVWSISPLERLRANILWKWNTILTDVLWKNRNVPREHHKIDLSSFSPDQYTGTPAERMKKAQDDAKAVIDTYRDNIKHKMQDQGFISDKNTEIDYVEPKTASYNDPNELVDQINSGVFATIGITESYARGVARGSFASEIALNSLNALIAGDLARVIRKELLKVLKQNLVLKGIDQENANKVDLKLQLVLSVDRGELVRQIAVLAATGMFTTAEIRELIGYEPLTEDQVAEISKTVGQPGRAGQSAQTVADVTRDYVARAVEPERPLTPQSRRDKQKT